MDDNKVKYYPYEEYPDDAGQYPQEENDGYYQDDGGSQKGSDKSIKTLIGILVAVLLVFVILLGVFVAMKKKDKDGNPAGSNATATDAIAGTTAYVPEQVTTEEQRYQPGEYVVTAQGNVRLREDHSIDSKHIMSVPSGTKLTITEVYIDAAAADDEQKFWGKTDYKGWTAWVALAFLSKSDGAGTATPEATTAEGASDTAATTAAADETTTKKDDAAGAYSTGKYVVTSDVGFVRLREGHSVDTDGLAEIPTDEEITVLEVYHDEDADDESLEYWGKVSYDGEVGWVALYYTAPVN